MAVLTALTADEVSALVAGYGLGRVQRLEGIAGGSVNSNYAVVAAGQRLFLRVYEERDVAAARRETAMLERLAAGGVPTPAPLRRLDGDAVSTVRSKAVAVFPWKNGTMRCQAAVGVADARGVGGALARVHLAGARESPEPGRFEAPDLLRRIERIAADSRFAPLAAGLRDDLARVEAARDRGAPRGLVHGDLFRDNVLWDEAGGVAALLDFESACEGAFAYDLMVTVLSWCVGDDLDARLATALREGYEAVRPLGARERDALWAEGCFAAVRFTITRITDYAMRDGAAGPRVVKDWRRFRMRHERLVQLGQRGLLAALGV